MEDETLSFLALGDSYTIGEAVKEYERWPVQLVSRLRKNNISIEEAKIVAKTGWTTDELIAAIEERDIQRTYDLVTLLIGVNNQYRGYPIEQYEKEFEELVTKAIKYAAGIPENVFVISIPDYGVTPFAVEKELDAAKIASDLEAYNDIARRIATSKNIIFTDITQDSKDAKNDPSLTAKDGLHPSSKMYALWVEALYLSIYDNLSTR
ncbi:MAG: SGNH/GDSL hydrolase family protein [Cyclobacteriaceae bacterium]